MKKRLSERMKVFFPVKASIEDTTSHQKSFNLEGRMVNISNNGACLILNQPLEKSLKLNIDIKFLPNYYFTAGEESFRANVSIIWIRSFPFQVYRYRYGVRFLNHHDTQILRLNRLLQMEKERLSYRDWNISHPEVSFPSVPISAKILDNLRPSALSVDITNACNLRCKHCFWDSHKEQLPDTVNANILNSVKEALKKFPSITNITWFGGEPFLKEETRKLLKQGVKFKKNNLVITNGTVPIPYLGSNVHVAISVDGTKEINDRLRGKGVYDKIKQHALSAIERRIPILLLYCLNAINIDCVPDFLEEWSKTKIDDVVFTMYTPLKGRSSYLILSDEQREKTVSLLLDLKKKYGRLISNSKLMIELLRAKYGEELAKNCPMNVFNKKQITYCLHMCNDGSIRLPCALGPNSSHLYCRSVTKIALYAGMVLRDRESFVSLVRNYHSAPHTKKNSRKIFNIKRNV